MLHICIVDGISRINGHGLFAIAQIRAGEVTWLHGPISSAPSGAVMTRALLAQFRSAEREAIHTHACQIGPDTWCAGSPNADPSLLMNRELSYIDAALARIQTHSSVEDRASVRR